VFISKHSFYARKVVPMDERKNERREKSSVPLGFTTLNKKRGKNSEQKLHHKSS
jgi:hypothetical protein